MSEDMIMSRRPPLHTCAASFLAIIHTACRKAQENSGALGILAKGISKPMSIALPLVYAVQYQWLAIFRYADDWILEFEKLAERIFPPSTILFDKIDVIVSTAEIIPEMFDDALNNRPPVKLHLASFLEWAFMRIIWGLDLNRTEEEKEIMMDMNSSTVTESSSSAAAKDANCPAGQEPLPEAEEKTERLSGKDMHTVEFSAIDESGESVSTPLADDHDDSCKESAGHVRGKIKSKTKTSGEKIDEKNTGEKQRKKAEEKTERLSGKDKHTVEFSAIDESGESVSTPLADDHDDSCKESAGDVRGKSKSKSKTKTSGEKIDEKNTGEKQRKKAKDPVLELFESKWLI